MTIEFTIPAMNCNHCVGVITRTVQQQDPAARVECDLATHAVRVDTTRDRATIAAALSEAGYDPA
jgi:copper chaperone